MGGDVREWVHLLLRWIHVIAGAFWIGQTAFFSWLDAQSSEQSARARAAAGSGGASGGGDPGSAGARDVWMVHSGGFYRVERVAPRLVPGTLHWFRWEAAATWVTGFLLLNVIYYHGGVMVDGQSRFGPIMASVIGIAALVLGWIAYDLLWMTPLARNERLAAALSLLALALVAWGLTGAMTGRAAYIHVGSLFGTIMAANVWMRILPAQRRMVRAIERGEPYDETLAGRAKQRSKHNSFLAIPLAFLMVSSHFPTASYGHRLNWIVLWVFLLGGFAARAAMNAWDRRSA